MSDFECLYSRSDLRKKNNREVNFSIPEFLDVVFHENGERAKHLNYFHLPPNEAFPLNLNVGAKEIQSKLNVPFEPDMGKFQYFFLKNNGLSVLQSTDKKQIFTTRNVLRSVMTFPYSLNSSKFHPFKISVTKFGDVTYLARINKEHNSPNIHEGYHFRLHKYCLSDSPHRRPNPDEEYDSNRTLYGLFRSTVDDFELVYTGEIIGVESKEVIEDFKNKSLNAWNFTSTKIAWDPETFSGGSWTKSSYILGTWVQCYLSCIQDIYIAFKTKDGFIKKDIERIKIDFLLNNQPWKAEVCKKFLRDFLTKLESVVAKIDCPYTVFEFHFDPQMETIKYRKFEGKTEHSFLTDEFIQYMQRK